MLLLSTTLPVPEKAIQASNRFDADTSFSGRDASGHGGAATAVTNTTQPCAACLARSRTHLIEIINYPLLHHAATRRKVLSNGEYDAVVLVYDVGSRASFEHVRALHTEVISMSAHERLGKTSSSRWKTRQRRGSRFSVFGGASGGEGKESVGWRKEGAGKTVVAVVGSKCDLDGDYVTPDSKDEDGGCNEKVKVVDYTIPLRGRQSLFGNAAEQGDSRAALTASRACQNRSTLLRCRPSTETIDGFFWAGKNDRPTEFISTGKEASMSLNASGSQAAVGTRTQRQVSNDEGEALAPELATQVPFFEVSAKTGKNVEEMFEAVARAALREMGRGEVDPVELTKRCRHQDRFGEGEDAETRLEIGDVAWGLDFPGSGPAPTFSEVKNSSLVRPVEIEALGPRNMGMVPEKPLVSRSIDEQHPRRESVVERVRKRFIKETPP